MHHWTEMGYPFRPQALSMCLNKKKNLIKGFWSHFAVPQKTLGIMHVVRAENFAYVPRNCPSSASNIESI